MIEHCRFKCAGYVTDTAILCARNVTEVLLSHRTRTIITVTFCAVIYPAGMIKGGVSETIGVMAGAAILSVRGWMVSCCSSGSSRNIVSIMTRGAITGDTRVIEN